MPEEFLNPGQRRALAALCDTLVPSLPGPDSEDPHGFWARAASDLRIPDQLEIIIRDLAADQSRRETLLLLTALANPVLAAPITGHFKAFSDLSQDQRTGVLRHWSLSSIPHLRKSFQGLKRLTAALFYSLTDSSGGNPNWPAIGYPGPSHARSESSRPIMPRTISADTTLEADVVIVGSGAGGGVVAGELALAGHKVVVLEKGGYYAEPDFGGLELEGYRRLYENQANLATSDLGVVVFAGSNLGGGTTINWCSSFRTPEKVLLEWERDHRLAGVAGPELQASFKAVIDRCHIDTDESQLSPQNEVLAWGAEALGYHWSRIPRNVKGCGDCGHCGYGCPSGAKQGTLKTYLQDAAAAGAQIVVNAHASEVLVRAGRAIGVRAEVGSGWGGGFPAESGRDSATAAPTSRLRQLTVKAKVIVVAAGAIHSPALLVRSGLGNSRVGGRLFLHPTTAVIGEYDRLIESWRGVPQSAVVDQFVDLDGQGYGFRLETPPAHPGMLSLGLRWTSGRQHKEWMTRARNIAAFIVLLRERTGGRVTVDRKGRPVMHYRLSKDDAPHMLRGIQEAFRVHAAAGAREIAGPHLGTEPYRSGDLESYLAALEPLGFRPNAYVVFSAHQMGTCPMGGFASRSVVDPHGEHWDVKNLFVADASIFPTASGANPMLTIMALAHRTAGYIKTRL